MLFKESQDREIIFKYTWFAVIATATNIFCQDISIRIYDGRYGVFIAVAVGTAVALPVKYFLDKRYIFRFQITDVFHDTRIFFLYSSMGLITTAVFWVFEFSFHFIFESKEYRYLGGLIGLIIGYFAKYHLDKKYVFK